MNNLAQIPLLMQGDCLQLMELIPDGSVDMVLCDLPYGTTACKWDTIIPFEPLWAAYRRVCRPGAAIVLTASQPFTSALGASNLKELQYSWLWDKQHPTGHLNAKKRPLRIFEDILVFYSKQPVYNPQDLIFNPKKMYNSRSHCARGGENVTSTVSGGMKPEPYVQEYSGYPNGIISIKSMNGNSEHPTQKPVALMEYLIRTYTNADATVLDNCMGSGTTGVACQNTGRQFIGIEQNDKYFAIAQQRILEASPCNI